MFVLKEFQMNLFSSAGKEGGKQELMSKVIHHPPSAESTAVSDSTAEHHCTIRAHGYR